MTDYGPNLKRAATPGVRRRVARSGERPADETLSGLDDETIAEAITGVAAVLRRWAALPAGEVLRLSWPLERERLIDATRQRTNPVHA